MPFRVSGKNIDIGEALRERINARVLEALGKHVQGAYSGHATVSRDGFGFRTECAIHLASGITLEADALSADAYASADQAVQRIEKRLRRHQRRLKDHHNARAEAGGGAAGILEANTYVLTSPESDGEEEVTEFNPVVVAESTTVLRLLPVSEAVMELDLAGAPIFVFRNAAHGRVNIVYRRQDGNIGWVDPPHIDPGRKH
jgi:ribosomal subunit interface protein